MKRVSLILLLACCLSLLVFTPAFAQRATHDGFSDSATLTAAENGICGWGDLDGQVKFGKLYAGPGFNLKVWLRRNPGITMDALNLLNPTVESGPIGPKGTGLAWGSLVGCNVIVLPSR